MANNEWGSDSTRCSTTKRMNRDEVRDSLVDAKIVELLETHPDIKDEQIIKELFDLAVIKAQAGEPATDHDSLTLRIQKVRGHLGRE